MGRLRFRLASRVRQSAGDQPGNLLEHLGGGIASSRLGLETAEVGDAALPDFRLGGESVVQGLGMGKARGALVGSPGRSSVRLDARKMRP